MSNPIETFFAAWGEADADHRARQIRDCLSPQVTYADPRSSDMLHGIDAVVGYVAMYTEYAPGATARVVDLSETKGHWRATVAFEMSDGVAQLGQYFIEVDEQQRPVRLIGFVGLGEPA